MISASADRAMSMALWEDETIADHQPRPRFKAAFEQIPGVEIRSSQARTRGHPGLGESQPSGCSAASRLATWSGRT